MNKDLDELLAVVEKVMPIWAPLFDGRTKVYCGFVDGTTEASSGLKVSANIDNTVV